MAQDDSQMGEPIAIIGMACRFPGADDYDAFWRLLASGTFVQTEGTIGEGPGRMGQFLELTEGQQGEKFYAAFIDDIDKFDAEFFRISPVEAQLLDPQQRLMLETCWRALEDAGIDADKLQRSRTGVYGGVSNHEYRSAAIASVTPDDPTTSLHALTGSSSNTAIGRVAYVLDLRGPAVTIDTACSSSLVAIHQAATGLRRGEADLALAGGVNAILSATISSLRMNAGMLSPSGRCKTFDEDADGYLRGEGCGVIALKRLSDAERDGDRIWGVILGSALNQDGASQGLTVPNAASQESVINDALATSGISATDVDYMEAHGTGTPVGDPAELQAAASAYGKNRPTDKPLLIGSVKTNFGHLETASGMAAIIKVILSMRRGVIPPHLHFENPTSAINWEEANLNVTTESTAWPHVDGRTPVAGISGFGWSGTNAHIIVKGYGEPETPSWLGSGTPWPLGAPQTVGNPGTAESIGLRETRFLPLSAKSHDALRELAGRYLSRLDELSGGPADDVSASDPALSDMAWTASTGRSHFRYRSGVIYQDAGSLRVGLAQIAENAPQNPTTAPSKIAFVYTGQGSQWVGMAQALYETEPVAREILDRCEAVVQSARGESLLDVMFGRSGNLDDSAWAQPATYAVECMMTALWKSIGVEPSVVAGHSLGEFAAAQAAGVYSLEEGMRLVAARGSIMSPLAEGAAMAAIFAPQGAVQQAIEEQHAASGDDRLCIGLDHGINQVISGPDTDVDAVVQKFEQQEVRVRRLLPSAAFHSAMLEPALGELERAASEIVPEPQKPNVALICDFTGKPLEDGVQIDATYWVRHSRQRVLFRNSMESLAELGVDCVIELGPGTTLSPIIPMLWPQGAPVKDPPAFSSLERPHHDETEPPIDLTRGFVTAVSAAYKAGIPVDFSGLYAGETRRRVAIPEYPFQRRRHWIEEPRRQRSLSGHPLLGTRHETPRGEVYFETELLPDDPGWLSDHRVFGRVVAPGALYGVMAMEAFRTENQGAVAIDDMQIQAPLVFSQDDDGNERGDLARAVQLMLEVPDDSGARGFEIYSRESGEDSWTLHARGMLTSAGGGQDAADPVSIEELRAGLPTLDVPEFYRAKRRANVEFGPLFRTVDAAWVEDGKAVGEVVLPEELARPNLAVHPVLLDACLQVVAAARIKNEASSGTTYLPFAWDRLWLSGSLPDRIVCRATLRDGVRADDTDNAPLLPEVITADLEIYSMDGEPLGGIEGFTVKRASRDTVLASQQDVQDLLYDIIWEDRPLPPLQPADFLPEPASIQATTPTFAEYLSRERVGWDDRTALLADLERLSWSFALATLSKLGWQYSPGDVIDPETLRQKLGVTDEHSKLFVRILELLARASVLKEVDGAFHVLVGSDESLPTNLPPDPNAFAAEMLERYPHGSIEIELCSRAAGELADILQANADPLTVLFGSGYPTPGDLFISAPATRATNNMLGDAIAALLKDLPEGRRLRIIEVGAGTGSATASVLPELPTGRFDYVYTDISAGFFAEAEAQFGTADGAITYVPLNIEVDPVEQGFDAHGYDLVIASNVLHDTISLKETLQHCVGLLAPSGQLLAIETIESMGWQDVTFGTLDGWWRFADEYRSHHGIAEAPIWERALSDAAFEDPQILGLGPADYAERPDRAVIIASAPAEIVEQPGVWVVAADDDGMAEELAAALTTYNQQVVIVSESVRATTQDSSPIDGGSRAYINRGERGDWQSIFEELPADIPLRGVVHLAAASGNGSDVDTETLADDVQRVGSSALAMVQGMLDSDSKPKSGIWLVSRGAQGTRREQLTQPAGAILWGFGRVLIRELTDVQTRVIDLDGGDSPLSDLVDELLRPDGENHIALHSGYRQVAHLARSSDVPDRLVLSDTDDWRLGPDPGGDPGRIHAQTLPQRELEPDEVRVAPKAIGINFRDVLISIGLEDEADLGTEFSGHVTEIGE
ncbi:MAG: beta-ketoacyl synthase N-terminal-like domain-containing protein, partial [Chloroflexi bacterium]|nr:beta-ketoacyl synthase N-terminal-like domain-containing protein [Chloroflexota bacterium]